MSTITIENLEDKANVFLKRHYNEKELPEPSFKWERWNLKGERPYNILPGCYAQIFKNKDDSENIEYIGGTIVSIGNRLNNYHQKKADEQGIYEPKEKWKGLIGFYILGINKKIYYLAPALELFLIRDLKPQRNRIGMHS